MQQALFFSPSKKSSLKNIKNNQPQLFSNGANKNEGINILGFKSIDMEQFCKYQYIVGCRIEFFATWHNNCQSSKAKTET